MQLTNIKVLVIFLTSLIPLCATAQDVDKAYSKFDYIPGEEVVYYNNFESDAKGELPIGWNTNGNAEVITLNGTNWVKLFQNATFITDNKQEFSENFTVEFDLFLDFKFQDAMFPVVAFGILGSGNKKTNSNEVLQNISQYGSIAIDLNTGLEQNSFVKLTSHQLENEFFNSGEKSFKPLENMLQKTIHVSMQVQQQRFRIWLNETKIFDVPQAMPELVKMNQLFFRVFESSYTNEQIGIYVTNIRIAKGIPDVRKKLSEGGKYVTSGILFDVNSAKIKPDSYGIIREVAAVLKSDVEMKVIIVGHTDSDGDKMDNLKLSKERSDAVKQVLTKNFGINPDRIVTNGKGESDPIIDNATKEAKAMNRRVEFIKI